MAAGPNPNPPSDRKKLVTILVPTISVAVLVLVVVLISSMSGSGRSMSDGSNGGIDDPDLKEASAGVKYRDLKEGDGPPCPSGAKVKVHYTGWLSNGTVFDSTKDKAAGFQARLVSGGQQGVIVGWQEGIPGMKVGGVRKLVIAPEKGYGSQAAGSGKIPPNTTLVFEVELLEFTPPARPRRSPIPTDLTRLSDGTLPNAADPDLKPIGNAGLRYRDLKEGDGAVVQRGDYVVVDYIGWRHSDGGLFDSSFKARSSQYGDWLPQGEPLPSSLDGLVPGWQQGIPGMKIGGIRKLVIPPDLGYGSRGAGRDIPPNATLVFEVELLGIGG